MNIKNSFGYLCYLIFVRSFNPGKGNACLLACLLACVWAIVTSKRIGLFSQSLDIDFRSIIVSLVSFQLKKCFSATSTSTSDVSKRSLFKVLGSSVTRFGRNLAILAKFSKSLANSLKVNWVFWKIRNCFGKFCILKNYLFTLLERYNVDKTERLAV